MLIMKKSSEIQLMSNNINDIINKIENIITIIKKEENLNTKKFKFFIKDIILEIIQNYKITLNELIYLIENNNIENNIFSKIIKEQLIKIKRISNLI